MQSYMPINEEAREYALSHLLTKIISENYKQARVQIGLEKPSPKQNLRDSFALLQEDSSQNNADLISWGYLYFQYTRVDLGIGLDDHSEALAINVRTLRRYKTHGIKRLTAILLAHERNRKKRILIAELPHFRTNSFVGRENEVIGLIELLKQLHRTHVFVTGAVGIGKTYFVRHVILRLIENNEIDRLAWVDWVENDSDESIIHQLHRKIATQRHNDYSDSMLANLSTLIVIDNCKGSDARMLINVLQDNFPHANVVLIGQTNEIGYARIEHLHLRELTLSDTSSWLTIEIGQQGKNLATSAKKLWELSGGNPGFINQYFTRLESNYDSLTKELQSVFAELGEKEKALCCVLAILDQPTELKLLIAHWTTSEIETLVARGIANIVVQGEFSMIGITPSYQQLIRTNHDSFPEFQQHIIVVIHDSLGSIFDEELCLLLAESILLNGDWLNTIYFDVRDEMFSRFWELGGIAQHFSKWVKIFSDFEKSLTLEQQYSYALATRAMGQFKASVDMLGDVVQTAGMQGRFYLQAKSELEICITLYQSGNYEAALSRLKQLRNLPIVQHEDSLFERASCLAAQIALDEADYQSAETILEELWDRQVTMSREHRALIFALRLFQGNFEVCQNHLPFVLIKPVSTYESVLLGQYFAQIGDYEASIDLLTHAIFLLEWAPSLDIFRLARTRTNLASVLIQVGEFEDARILLELALETQSEIHDKLGFITTKHNLDLVDNHRG